MKILKAPVGSQFAVDALFLPVAVVEFLIVGECLAMDFPGRLLVAVFVLLFMGFQIELGFGRRIRTFGAAIAREYRVSDELIVRHEPEPSSEALPNPSEPPVATSWRQSQCAFFKRS
jgi:hypothetical protein